MTFKMPIVSKDEMALRFHQNWREQNPDDIPDNGSVDDCLTNLNWLQNLNIMTKIGAPTPETPPASPVPSPDCYAVKGASTSSYCLMTDVKGSTVLKAKVSPCKHVPEDVDYKTNGTVKPPYSYATLICMAMKANKNKMTLSSIYKWIKENFMYYRNADPSWQNSIRHNLSLNKCFIKIPRSKDEPGKGGFWRLDPEYAESLVDGVFKKRRPAQRQTNGGPATSKKSRKDRHKVQNGTITRVLETFQQDTPPSSAGSLLGHAEMDMMSDMRPLVMSPSHHEAYIAAANICEFPGDHVMGRPQRQQDKVVVKEEYLQVLEPMQQCTTTGLAHSLRGIHASNVANNGQQQQQQQDLCWNEVLGEPDLELESLYKYRPEESISSVVNTALALNEDLFSSDGSSSDLPTELDLVSTACNDQLDLNNGLVGHQADWWGCFHNSPFDLALTPVLSISVPFNNGGHPQSATSGGGGVFVNNYVQGPGAAYMVESRPQSQQESGHVVVNGNQPWAECKAALEAADLDLDDLGDLDPVHAY